jgi:hypothetical protein
VRVGLFGYPVAHSASPRMHNAAFAALGLADWRYELWETAPEDLGGRIRTTRHRRGQCDDPNRRLSRLDGVSGPWRRRQHPFSAAAGLLGDTRTGLVFWMICDGMAWAASLEPAR